MDSRPKTSYADCVFIAATEVRMKQLWVAVAGRLERNAA